MARTWMPVALVLVAVSSSGCGETANDCIHPQVIKRCSDGWCEVPAGCFVMGSPANEHCRDQDEQQRPVTLTHGFTIQATEVTQGEFEALMGYNPSIFVACGTNCPVEKVGWHGAASYCNALSARLGLQPCYSCVGTGPTASCREAAAYSGQRIYSCPGYRLPTEAEWEYAYRAGTTTAYYSGPNVAAACDDCEQLDPNADKIAWHMTNAAVTYANCVGHNPCGGCLGPHPVAQKQANAWGLYDMAGNVAELCNDWHVATFTSAPVTDPIGGDTSSSYRVVRNSSCLSYPKRLRAANRDRRSPTAQSATDGFRCVRTR